MGVRGRPKKKNVEALKKRVAGLYAQGLRPAQIAKLQGCSRQYVSNIVRQLKQSDSLFQHHTSDRSPRSDRKNVHAQKIRAYVHYAGEAYKKSPHQYYKEFVPGVSVSCQAKYIYLVAEGHKFSGSSESKALWSSIGFWRDVLNKLESRLGVTIFKPRSMAFEFLYQEYETSDSAVALDAEKKGHVWKVFHAEDGKLRLSVDWSDKIPSHETHHKRDGHADSITFERHVNSILDNPQAPTYGELVSVVKEIAALHKETAAGLKGVVSFMQQQKGLAEDLREANVGGERPSYMG